MAIDYKKELESAAKNMIMIHEPDLLIKMIVRTIVQKVRVSHAAILLQQKEKNSYLLTVSRGRSGVRIPPAFARMDKDNPLIRIFLEGRNKKLFNNDGVLVYGEAQKLLKKKIPADKKELLRQALYQMELFGTVACIPSYYSQELLGMLLLGDKNDGKRFLRGELDFFLALSSDVAMAIRNAQLFRELAYEIDRKNRLFIHTTIALAAAIEAKDNYTHGHIGRVTALSLEIARKLALRNKLAQEEKFMHFLQIASLLHDIGKIGIPESILNKEGSLSDDERKKMQEHPMIGTMILQPIQELEDALLGVRYHHERYDGQGYPEGLKGEQIPLIASIIAVADSFDAMTTDRPYHKGFTKEEAIDEIRRSSGTQFNPQIAAIIIELFQEGKI